MKFDLEQFKQGVNARTRDGRIATFIGMCKDCHDHNRVVTYIGGGCNVITFSTNGTYTKDEANENDLVSMVSPWENVPIDTKVKVRSSGSREWLNRHFAGLSSKGKPTAWANGTTSWTAEDSSTWDFMELAE
jgi:hypothetical protein